MERKELFEQMLERVDEDRRQEAYDRLAAVETRAEKVAIMADYGVDLSSPEVVFGEGWEEDSRELTDDELKQVAGGFDWSRNCNCEP